MYNQNQTKLQKKTFDREVIALLMAFLVIAGGSWMVLSKPSIDDISRDVFDGVPVEKREIFLSRANQLLTDNPSLVSSPRAWERELKRLVMH